MSIFNTNPNKTCPFISSPEKLTKCIGDECMLFGADSPKRCRLASLDIRLEQLQKIIKDK